MYKLGSQDRSMIKLIQEALRLPVDGIFGPKTQRAVINFQMDHHLVADGIVGRATLEELGILDTDLKHLLFFKTDTGLIIQRHHLPKGEYIQNEGIPIINNYLFLHHTGGWDNPFNTIDQWARDNRGRIATEFVIGGQNIRSGNDEFDGVTVQAFPEGNQGWHLGAAKSQYMNKHSVGIEMCNFGQLNEKGRNYIGVKAHPDQIVKLDEDYKSYRNFHRYSNNQLKSLKNLILHIANRDNIDIRKGLIEWIHKEGIQSAFNYHEDAAKGEIKGLLIHANVRKDKFDVFPQDELIDMLLNL